MFAKKLLAVHLKREKKEKNKKKRTRMTIAKLFALNENSIKLKERINRWIKLAFDLTQICFSFLLFVCSFHLCVFSQKHYLLDYFLNKLFLNEKCHKPGAFTSVVECLMKDFNCHTLAFIRSIYLLFLHVLHIINEIHTPANEYIVSFLVTAAVAKKY